MSAEKNNLGSLFLLYGTDKMAKAEARKRLIGEAQKNETAEVKVFEINPEKDFSKIADALAQINNRSIFDGGTIFVLKIQLEGGKRKGENSAGADSKDFFSRERCRAVSSNLAQSVLPGIQNLDSSTTIIFDFYFELDAKNDFLIAAEKDRRFAQIKYFKAPAVGNQEGKESFQFVDSAVSGKNQVALFLLEKIIQDQRKKGLDEVAIALNLLGLLAFRMNRMIALKEVEGAEEAKNKLGISPYFFQQEKNQTESFSKESLFRLFKKIVSAQQKAKSGLYSPLSLIATIVLAFSTEKQRQQSV